MAILKFLKKAPKLELHALEPEETWYERACWLALLAKELKAEVENLRSTNTQLMDQVHAGGPFTVTEQEYLTMRTELKELQQVKAKLDKRLRRYAQVNQGLIDEVHDLRNGIGRAA